MKPETTRNEESGPAFTAARNSLEDQILRTVRDVKFGSVEITVHEGRIVQVERREKIRFPESR
jgi:hypothetical protein